MRLKSRSFFIGLAIGIGLICLGLFLPHGWYDTLPKQEIFTAPPVEGITLLQITFVIEGLVIIFLSIRGWTYKQIQEPERLLVVPRAKDDETLSRTKSHWLLAGITLLALILRVVGAGSDLWLDEIASILDYQDLSIVQVIGTFLSTNHHLLNTLLMKISISLFGPEEWAIRLPAIIFGTAAIPALYWVARIMASRWVSLGASLLMAVSYHHVFFSQNARGYSGYIFFSLLSTGLLIQGLQEDRLRTWSLYVLATLFNIASILISFFVLAAQFLVSGTAVVAVRQRGASPLSLTRRIIGIYALISLLSFQLYATILPQAYAWTKYYENPSSRYTLFSVGFIQELVRGVSMGIGSGAMLIAIPVIILGAIIGLTGFIALFRRHWVLTLGLSLPVLLIMVGLTIFGWSFYPRFFLVALPITFLAVVQGLFSSTTFVFHRLKISRESAVPTIAGALVMLLCLASLVSLRYYYSVPKQPYRDSLQYLEGERNADEIVIVVYTAEKGVRYYGERLGIDMNEGENYYFVRTEQAFDQVLAENPEKQPFIITTFPRALSLKLPEIREQIANSGTLMRNFPATIGDGQISIWRMSDAAGNNVSTDSTTIAQ